jgi:hypothetical protein
MTIVTDPPYLTESLALALEYDPDVTMKLAALPSEGITRYISMLEETPCGVLITDLKVDLP